MNPRKTIKDVPVTVLVPPSDHLEFKLMAKQLGVSLAGFFRLAGREYKIRQQNFRAAA